MSCVTHAMVAFATARAAATRPGTARVVRAPRVTTGTTLRASSASLFATGDVSGRRLVVSCGVARDVGRRSVASSSTPRAEFDGDEKMYVPPGAFGGTTPERKASQLLQNMMTYIACWIVIDQTETTAPRISTADGTDPDHGEGGENEGTRAAARVTNVHDFLLDFLEANPVRDADAFLEKLVRADPAVARRVMDVRRAYASGDFEWDNTRRLVLEDMAASSARVLKEHLSSTLAATERILDPDAVVDDSRRTPSRWSKPSDDARDPAVREQWRRVRGRTPEYVHAFADASAPMRERGTWVLKSLDGLIEFGLDDLDRHADSIANLGGDLATWGALAEDCDAMYEGLMRAVRAELRDTWDDDAEKHWASLLSTFRDMLREGLARGR
jgi:hypothetical protein